MGEEQSNTHNFWSATGQAGYFVANRLLVGLQFSYGANNLRFESYNTMGAPSTTHTEQHHKYYTPEVFARYYFANWKVKPFAQLSGGWNLSSGNLTEFSGLSTKLSDNNFAAKAALGVSFKIGKRANIDLLYSQSLTKSRNFGDANGLRLGATFLLGK